MSQIPILVTGGAGYIGSPVCRALEQRGYLPVTLDNLSRGHRDAVRFGPLIEGDIGDAALVHKICAQYKPKAAMHFAAFIEVAESIKSPDIYLQNNWEQTRLFADALRDCGINNIVYSSTAAVYGIPGQKGAITETLPLKPLNPYGESKLKAETYLLQSKKLRCVALRYFNAAGAMPEAGLGEAHWPETHLIPNALLSLLGLKKEPLMIFGQDYPTPDGTAVRDYVHCADIAEAHILALEYLLNEGESTAINLGAGKGTSVKEIVDMITEITGKPLHPILGKRRSGDPAFLVADNRKALAVLGWKPGHDLEAIINSAWQWHTSEAYGRLAGLKP